LSLASVLVAPVTGFSAPLGYDYAQLGFGYDFASAFDKKPRGAGFDLGGAVSIQDNFFVSGEYSDINLSKGVANLKRGSLGAGYDNKISDSTLAYGEISYQNLEVKKNEIGFGLEGGLRYAVSDDFEANGGIEFIDVEKSRRQNGMNFEGQPGLKLGASYNVAPAVAVVGGYEYLKDDSSLRLSLRYSFDS
jgi:opacity protein-like surface antigen